MCLKFNNFDGIASSFLLAMTRNPKSSASLRGGTTKQSHRKRIKNQAHTFLININSIIFIKLSSAKIRVICVIRVQKYKWKIKKKYSYVR